MKNFILVSIFFLIYSILNEANAQWYSLGGPQGHYAGNVLSLVAIPNENGGTNLIAGTAGTYQDGLTYPGDIFLSTDFGLNWSEGNIDNGAFNNIKVNDTTIYAENGFSLYLSLNRGKSWVNPYFYYQISALAISGTYLIVASPGHGVYFSTDNGSNWTFSGNGINQRYVTCLEASGTRVLAGTQNYGIYGSTIGSKWYQGTLGNLYINCMAIVGTDLFVGTPDGIIYSCKNLSNAGWSSHSSGLPGTAILCLAASGNNVFAGTYGSGVFLSTDNGSNWEAFNDGLDYKTIYSLAVNDGYLFAGSYGTVSIRKLIPTSINEITKPNISNFVLYQNYPNPFNPTTTINYDLPRGGKVLINIYDMIGRKVRTLVNEYKSAGSYSIEFGAKNLTNGIYFYRMQSGDFIETKKLVLMK